MTQKPFDFKVNSISNHVAKKPSYTSPPDGTKTKSMHDLNKMNRTNKNRKISQSQVRPPQKIIDFYEDNAIARDSRTSNYDVPDIGKVLHIICSDFHEKIKPMYRTNRVKESSFKHNWHIRFPVK
jgi:hypothetical protein